MLTYKEYKQCPRPRKICDFDKKYDFCDYQNQNDLIARNCNTSLAKKQYHSVGSTSRGLYRQAEELYLMNNNIAILYSEHEITKIFPEITVKVTYRIRKKS